MKGTTVHKARWRKRRVARRRSAQLSSLDRKRRVGSRFIPPDATPEERKALRFGSVGR